MTNQEFLKEGCRLHHDSIESALDLASLTGDREKLTSLLQALAGYYGAAEKLLLPFEAPLGELGLKVEERLKLPMLKKDLGWFGTSPIQPEPALEHIRTLEEALGALYVLEGSTLGGQVIYRKLLAAGTIDRSGQGGQFFYGYGPETGRRWTEFREVLNALPPNKRADLLASGQETFRTLEWWVGLRLGEAGRIRSRPPLRVDS